MIASHTEKFCLKCMCNKNVLEFSKSIASKDGFQLHCKLCQNEYKKGKRVEIRIRERNYENKNRIRIKERKNQPEYIQKRNDYMRTYVNSPRGRANRLFQMAKRRAYEKSIEFNITIERIENAIVKGTCERTGVKFKLSEGNSCFAPSLDRIDSFGTYVNDNIQIVCVAYNLGKQHSTNDEFEKFILEAAEFIGRNK